MALPRRRVERFLDESDEAWLRPWAALRYQSLIPTLELMARAVDVQEKEAVACVALLNLPDRALRCCACGDVRLEERLLARRRQLLERLAAEGIDVR